MPYKGRSGGGSLIEGDRGGGGGGALVKGDQGGRGHL